MNGLCRLVLDWTGTPPALGHYLKTPRGRTVYHIVGKREVRRREPAASPRFVLTCERLHPEAVPANGVGHYFRWYRR